MATSSIILAADRQVAGGTQLWGHVRKDVSDSMGPRVIDDFQHTWIWHPMGRIKGTEDGPKGAVAWLDKNKTVLGHQNVWTARKEIREPAKGYIWRSKENLLPPVGEKATPENTGGEPDTGVDGTFPGGSGRLTETDKSVLKMGGSLALLSLVGTTIL